MIVEPRRCIAPVYGPDPLDSCDDLADPDSDYCAYHSNPDLWDDENGDD